MREHNNDISNEIVSHIRTGRPRLLVLLAGAVIAIGTAGIAAPTGAAVARVAITTTRLPAAVVGVAYSATLSAKAGTAPYSWSISKGTLPAGLTLNPLSGVVSGTPTAVAVSRFTVVVTDSTVPAGKAARTYTVHTTGPAITTALAPKAVMNVPYSTQLAVVGGFGPYTWSVASGAMPAGLVLHANGSVTGTPTVSGTKPVHIAVADSSNPALVAKKTVRFPIAAVAVTSLSVPPGRVGVAYSTSFTAIGGTPPYVWRATLPKGLVLNTSTGAISGAPTKAETTKVRVQVKDAARKTATVTVPFVILPIAISTASVPNGQVGVAYSVTFAAVGGTAPLTWSVAAGSVPAGLSLNASTGKLSGTPTATGTSSFTIKVTDAAASSATAAFSMTVAPPPGPTITIKNFAFTVSGHAAPGQTVRVINNDTTTHTVTDSGQFNTGNVGAGTISMITAPSVSGSYNFMCTIHTTMMGVLVVD